MAEREGLGIVAASMAETMDEAAWSILRVGFSERVWGWDTSEWVGSWMLRSVVPKGRQGKMVASMSILGLCEEMLEYERSL